MKLIKNCCGFTQTGTRDVFLRSNRKAVHLIFTLKRTLSCTIMAYGLLPITNAMLADENVEDEGGKKSRKDVYDRGSDNNDEE